MFGNVKNSKEAWDILKKMFAKKFWARIMHLKERVSRYTKWTRYVTEFLQGIKYIGDELSIVPLPWMMMILSFTPSIVLDKKTNKQVIDFIHTRENPIGFEELHDLFTDFETHLKKKDTN